MDRELYDLALRNADRYAKSVVFGFFGEQMLHPNFEELVEAVPEKRTYKLILNSNWTLATARNMETLKRFDLVRISIDASNAELYEELCPGAPFRNLKGEPAPERYEALVEKIQYWLDLEGHPETWLIYVVSSVNEHDRERFVETWRPRVPSRDYVVTKSVISYGGVMRDPHMRSNPCRVAGQDRLVVGWNGTCSPCNLDVNLALNVGNLKEAKDLRQMVRSKRYREVINGIRRREGICSNCFDANNHTESHFYRGLRTDAED